MAFSMGSHFPFPLGFRPVYTLNLNFLASKRRAAVGPLRTPAHPSLSGEYSAYDRFTFQKMFDYSHGLLVHQSSEPIGNG